MLGNPLGYVDPSGMSMVQCTDPKSIACVGNDPDFATTSSNPYVLNNALYAFWLNSFQFLNSSGGGGGGGTGCGAPGAGSPLPVFRTIVFGRPPARNEVPDNACESAGYAFDPSVYAAAGSEAKWNPFRAVSDIANGFRIGGYLDAQPLATGDPYQRAAYGNYVFGAWVSASGTPLPIALAGAAGIAAIHKIANPSRYARRAMDPTFGSLPAANIINITRGYNDQRNGTLCHKQ